MEGLKSFRLCLDGSPRAIGELTMGPKTKQLVQSLSRLIQILEEAKEPLWATWFSQAKHRLSNSDFSGITKILGAYGGMGSFNDLVIGYSKKGPDENYINTNDEMDELREIIYSLAQEIKISQR